MESGAISIMDAKGNTGEELQRKRRKPKKNIIPLLSFSPHLCQENFHTFANSVTFLKEKSSPLFIRLWRSSLVPQAFWSEG